MDNNGENTNSTSAPAVLSTASDGTVSTSMPASTKRYKLLTGTHTHNGNIYRAWIVGENELDLTEEQARALGERVQEVSVQEVGKVGDKAGSAGDAGEVKEVNTTLPVDLSKSIPEIEKDLQKVDDTKTLDAVLAAEKKDRDRAGVEKAINTRREELEAEEETKQ